MQRFPRLGRILARRPRPASLLAAGTAVIVLGALGTIGTSDATLNDFEPKSAPTVTVVPDEDLVDAYNDGWADGRADLMGDDNRDGRIDEDESGWDCRRMGNRACGPQRDASHTSR